MRRNTIDKLNAERVEFPIAFAYSLPSQQEIDRVSDVLGMPLAADYKQFLRLFGGAMAGADPIYGLRRAEVCGSRSNVIDETIEMRELGVPGCDEWIIISTDGFGNPIRMDAAGAIWIHDHDFGGIAPLYPTFEAYLRHCLKLPELP